MVTNVLIGTARQHTDSPSAFREGVCLVSALSEIGSFSDCIPRSAQLRECAGLSQVGLPCTQQVKIMTLVNEAAWGEARVNYGGHLLKVVGEYWYLYASLVFLAVGIPYCGVLLRISGQHREHRTRSCANCCFEIQNQCRCCFLSIRLAHRLHRFLRNPVRRCWMGARRGHVDWQRRNQEMLSSFHGQVGTLLLAAIPSVFGTIAGLTRVLW